MRHRNVAVILLLTTGCSGGAEGEVLLSCAGEFRSYDLNTMELANTEKTTEIYLIDDKNKIVYGWGSGAKTSPICDPRSNSDHYYCRIVFNYNGISITNSHDNEFDRGTTNVEFDRIVGTVKIREDVVFKKENVRPIRYEMDYRCHKIEGGRDAKKF